MTDIHEETQLSLAHLLGMNMLLQSQAVLFLMTAVSQVLPESQCCYQQINEVSDTGAIPRCMDKYREAAFLSDLVVAVGYDTEIVVAWRHVTEGNLVDARLQLDPLFFVDAITVVDVLGVIVGEGR